MSRKLISFHQILSNFIWTALSPPLRQTGVLFWGVCVSVIEIPYAN